ncbi:hypothetical protein CONPUDRAFT_77819 [Coniophora puteana RWD-64-598 SS2]|uniref:Uncharacterized protein n=1 Tax=Coniophora puteana (strain RWD-64-598) TaxID=741705 RepID=A0A5M3M8T5_CONPW|nr:uncharacterized protein CONPUDRAFT_77819 [Coniophora puteana RWD-64-598 SS2]EIW75051.1 hypothetical protein CONPUDRAFT_77819 [Coniophora puteana RWD-64-598 SS2]
MCGQPNYATGQDMGIEHLINAMKAYYIPKRVGGHWGQLLTYAAFITVLTMMKTGFSSWQKSFQEWVRTNHYNFKEKEPEPMQPDKDSTSGGIEDLLASNESKEDGDSELESVHSDVNDTEPRGGNDDVDADMRDFGES